MSSAKMAAILLALALAACGSGRGGECADTGDCRSGLTCVRHAWPVVIDGDTIRLGPVDTVHLDGIPDHVPGLCITREDAIVIGDKTALAAARACQNSADCTSRFCQDLGTTTVNDPTSPARISFSRCVAAKDEDCRRSPVCKVIGSCVARDGVCVPGGERG